MPCEKDAETAPNTNGVKYVEGYKSGNFYYNGYIKGVGATGNVSQGNTLGTIGKNNSFRALHYIWISQINLHHQERFNMRHILQKRAGRTGLMQVQPTGHLQERMEWKL